ncbi:MAG TPA: type II CAAX endopeptidase family protein [Caulobacteraceae bacterium]|jgi:hypothetical protein
MDDESDSADLFAWAPTWRARGAALGKVLAFLAAGLVVTLLASVPVMFVHIKASRSPSLIDTLMLEAPVAVGIVLANGLMWLIWREPLARFGLGAAGRRGLHLGIGLAAGLGFFSALMLLLWALGLARFAGPSGASEALANGLVSVVLFAGVAIVEEGLFRGYGFVQLAGAVSFWPAAIVGSAIFTATHLTNAGETPFGLLHVAVFGLVAAYSVRRTGGIWFALGYHAAWDFTESFVWGAPDSGAVLPGALIHTVLRGPAMLSGGAAGPEGSVFSLVTELALLATAWALGRRKRAG